MMFLFFIKLLPSVYAGREHTVNVFKSALSFGFLFKQRSMKSMKALLNNPDGSFGGGSLTINSNNSNTAKDWGVFVPT